MLLLPSKTIALLRLTSFTNCPFKTRSSIIMVQHWWIQISRRFFPRMFNVFQIQKNLYLYINRRWVFFPAPHFAYFSTDFKVRGVKLKEFSCSCVITPQNFYKGHQLVTVKGWIFSREGSVDIRLNFVNSETHVEIKSAI
jgi:hypothetical protein